VAGLIPPTGECGGEMRSPYLIGFLSILPGLGLLVLRRIKASLLVWFAEALGAWIFLASSSNVLAGLGVTIVIATWVIQLHYAIQTAKQQERRQEAQEVSLPLYGEGQLPQEALQVSADGIVQPQLRPDEHLLASAVGMRPHPGGLGTQQYAIGVTLDDLVIIRLRPWGIPVAMERIPLKKVSGWHLEKGSLTDEIELQVRGEAERRAFYFYSISRPWVLKIAEAVEKGCGLPDEGRGDSR
jgi:hypothetical protein